jgi:hypothetical protein
MLRRFRPAGWLTAIGTLTAISATMLVASPGGAATPEKEYKAKFTTACIIAPGSLNQKGTLEVETSATGPESFIEGESIEFHNATSTITSPPELGNSLFSLGTRKVRGKVTNFPILGANLEPGEKNIAKPLEFAEGLPYETPVEQNKATSFKIPTTGTYSFGPFKVTGKAGENASLTVNTAAGYREIGAGEYEATGNGVVSTLEGINAEGGHVIGPLTVACTAPSGVVLGSTPILANPNNTSTTSSSTTSAASSTTTTAASSTTTTAATTSSTTSTAATTSAGTEVSFTNWKLTGSLTDKKNGNQVVNLPSGCTFNGKATVPGPLEGNTKCPAFRATLKVNALQTGTFGLELVQSEPVKGTITNAGGGNLTFKATAKDNILVKSVMLFGLFFPENCTTTEAVVFPLEATAPASALSSGTTFKGETTIPSFKCPSGFLGPSFGSTLTGDFSGPNNPFTLTIGP